MISYFEPNTVRENGLTYSVDMVRLSGEFLEDIDGRGHVLEFVRKINELSVIRTLSTTNTLVVKLASTVIVSLLRLVKNNLQRYCFVLVEKRVKEDWSGWALEFNLIKLACASGS